MKEDYLEKEKRDKIRKFVEFAKKQSYFNWLLEEIEKEKNEKAGNVLEFKRKGK